MTQSTQSTQNPTAKTRGRKAEVTGQVVSDKMQKTIAVQIFRLVRHAKYGKYIKRSSVFKAHDEKNEARVGDKVIIVEVRPMSKTKRWKLEKIVERAPTQEVLHDSDAK
jgi:small subunit ribosomal protein S17